MDSDIDTPVQSEMFADSSWIHIFRSMFSAGAVAKLGPYAFTTLVAIKVHTNFKTGEAFPSIDTLCGQTGISRPVIIKSIKTLENEGYLEKARVGRKSVYTLKEKIQLTDKLGRPTATATWDYIPHAVQSAVSELKRVVIEGSIDGFDAKVVQFKIANMQIIIGDNNTQNAQVVDLDGSLSTVTDPYLRDQIRNAYINQLKQVQRELPIDVDED
jgi:DNA-binding transcriptional regulator YhcF (GntR family)